MRHPRTGWLVWHFCILFLSVGLRGQTGPGSEQTGTEQTPPPAKTERQDPPPQQKPTVDRIATLRRLAESLNKREEARREARDKSEKATDPVEKAQALEAAKSLQTQIESLQADFAAYATGIDSGETQVTPDGKFNLVDELIVIAKPLIQELKDITEEPRATDQQRKIIAMYAHRREVAQRALDNLKSIDDPALTDRIRVLREEWSRRRTDAANRELIAADQLNTRLENQKSIVESASDGLSNFFRKSGLHILMALAAFCAVFFGLRFVTKPLRSAARRRRGDSARSIQTRIITVAFHSLVGLLSTAAVLLVFYSVGDWGLLGLSLLFLLGIAWASKEALPRYVRQMQLMLNIGPVREGERVVYQGLPWRVDRINMFSHLTNPALLGGRVRLPITDLLDLRSRPLRPGESWFPSESGDWVILSDGTRGKVVEQSPDMVRLEHIGGAHTTYQTKAYLDLLPTNIQEKFAVNVTFGVDYKHQAICTTVIPQKMQRDVESALASLLGAETLIRIQVAFKEAASSSLDYIVIAELHGQAAPRYAAVQREIQRSLVDACNANGWGIPFTQITVHQAEAG